MKRPIIVFDFDKTLTKKDSIFGFYKYVSGDEFKFKIKYPFFLILAIFTKFKLISNKTLKVWGVRLFLKNFDKITLAKKGREYAAKIQMNNIYENDFKKLPSEHVIVLSASFEEYLMPLFSECVIAGSKISYDDRNLVNGLDRNLYGTNKLKWLQDKGVENIDILFTDSYSDKPLMNISNFVYLVVNNEKNLIKGTDWQIKRLKRSLHE